MFTHLQQVFQALVVATVRGPVDGSVAVLVWSGGRASVGQEHLHQVVVATGRPKVNGRAAHVVSEREGGGGGGGGVREGGGREGRERGGGRERRWEERKGKTAMNNLECTISS